MVTAFYAGIACGLVLGAVLTFGAVLAFGMYQEHQEHQYEDGELP